MVKSWFWPLWFVSLSKCVIVKIGNFVVSFSYWPMAWMPNTIRTGEDTHIVFRNPSISSVPCAWCSFAVTLSLVFLSQSMCCSSGLSGSLWLTFFNNAPFFLFGLYVLDSPYWFIRIYFAKKIIINDQQFIILWLFLSLRAIITTNISAQTRHTKIHKSAIPSACRNAGFSTTPGHVHCFFAFSFPNRNILHVIT